jgi:hypothetical protein
MEADNTPMKPTIFSSIRNSVIALSFILCLLAIPAGAATWYVDNGATGANNGKSWTNAWTSLSFSGLAAGDTVYISGGPAGSTKTYNLAGNLTSVSGFTTGTAGNPVTYKIGQEAAHNGMAIFHCTTALFDQWLFSGSNYVISGDAGDSQMHFKITNYKAGFVLNNSSNVRIAYVDFSKMPTMGSINPGTGIEIDHCYFYMNDLATGDHAVYALSTGSTYDLIRFHHNSISVPYRAGGIGADALQFNGSGYSIYNNSIYGYSAAYLAAQHQDGQQATGNGSYIKIYSNLFVDLQNYPIYLEPQFGGYAHVRIYNNVMVNTSGAGSQAIAAGGWMSPLRTLDDCVIANNLGDGFANTFTCRDPSNTVTTGVFSNCYFYNNISLNCGLDIIDPGVTSSNNVTLTAAKGPAAFLSYIKNSSTNDYRLLSSATDLIGRGINLTAYFTTDKDGTSRVSSGAWDIGPYAYASGVSSPTKPSKLRVVSP